MRKNLFIKQRHHGKEELELVEISYPSVRRRILEKLKTIEEKRKLTIVEELKRIRAQEETERNEMRRSRDRRSDCEIQTSRLRRRGMSMMRRTFRIGRGARRVLRVGQREGRV